MTVPIILVAILLANLIYDLTGFVNKCLNRTKREKDIEKMDTYNSLYIQALREMKDYETYITRKHNDQIIYKIDGNFNGNIKGDNVTVILMGDGNINGNIESKDGNVVLIKGNINGNVKANKVVCPTNHNEKNCFECIVDITKHNPAKDVKSPELPVKTIWSCDIPSNNKRCSKCAFAKKMPYLCGINTDNEYDCLKFNKIVDGNYFCQDFVTVENLNNKINDIINRK